MSAACCCSMGPCRTMTSRSSRAAPRRPAPTPDEPAASAGERMLTAKIGCLPVIDDGGNLAGIVTEEDFLRWATMQMAHGGREVHAARGWQGEKGENHATG